MLTASIPPRRGAWATSVAYRSEHMVGSRAIPSRCNGSSRPTGYLEPEPSNTAVGYQREFALSYRALTWHTKEMRASDPQIPYKLLALADEVVE